MTDRAPLCRAKVRGFYAVVDTADSARLEMIGEHTTVVQLRDKAASPADLVELGRALAPRVRALGALFIVNDHVDVALAVGADGVHLGQDDAGLERARANASLIVGVSTHNAAQARTAIAAGADYLGYGPVFETSTKVDRFAVQGLDALREAASLAEAVPVVAIGGVTPARAPSIAATGAAAACAISAIWSAPAPDVAARKIAEAFVP